MFESSILFLCPHGGAKSVMAAAFFNQLAEEHALPFTATAAAVDDPYASVPQPVADLLLREGVDVRAFTPRSLDAEELRAAARIVSIGCDVDASTDRWDDVPQASEDLERCAAAIRRHVEALAEDLRGRR